MYNIAVCLAGVSILATVNYAWFSSIYHFQMCVWLLCDLSVGMTGGYILICHHTDICNFVDCCDSIFLQYMHVCINKTQGFLSVGVIGGYMPIAFPIQISVYIYMLYNM